MSKINRTSKSFVKLIFGIVIICVVGIALMQGWGWISTPTANRY